MCCRVSFDRDKRPFHADYVIGFLFAETRYSGNADLKVDAMEYSNNRTCPCGYCVGSSNICTKCGRTMPPYGKTLLLDGVPVTARDVALSYVFPHGDTSITIRQLVSVGY